jgi:MFS family permease
VIDENLDSQKFAASHGAACCAATLRGYMLTPLLGGVLADKYGGKLVLGGGILLWSLATVATPFAAATVGLALFTGCCTHFRGVSGWIHGPSRLSSIEPCV